MANALAAPGDARRGSRWRRRSISKRSPALPPLRGGRRRRRITVIDDFAHNPEKVSATLETVHAFPGRLLLMFQPHGYGPLRLMRDSLADCFARGLRNEDVLLMPEPVYFGGTVDRSIGSGDIVKDVVRRGRNALAFPDRNACGEKLVQLARSGDSIVVMGARDDCFPNSRRTCLHAFSKPGPKPYRPPILGVSIDRLLKNVFGDHGARVRLHARSYILHVRSS